MKRHVFLVLAGVAGLATYCAADPPEGVEVLTRGPVHEAYAEPAAAAAGEPVVVPKEPPGPIEEVPPDARPEGDNVVWVPGYWAWAEERSDFIWVSGFWRNAPPERAWVPGHWQQVEGGWSWVGGFWASTAEPEVEYVPAPPAPVDTGPTTPAPDPTSVYVPGVWVWREARYAWRPGFWVPYHAGWTYTPATYVWTPGGYVFVDGYWDYALHERGLLFAPVYVAPARLTARWTYTPTYVVAPDAVLGALFVRTATRSYYFGDYFDAGYERRGYVPWVDYRVRREVYDPTFAYYRIAGRTSQWDRHVHELYTARREGAIPRPPATFAEQARLAANPNAVRVQNQAVLNTFNVTNVSNFLTVTRPLNQVNETRINLASAGGGAATATTVRVQPVPADQRARLQESTRQYQSLVQQRQRQEVRGAEGRGEGARTARFDFPRAEVKGNVGGRPQAGAPPARPKLPAFDARTQPPAKGPDRTRPGDPKADRRTDPRADPKAPAPKTDPKADPRTPRTDPKSPTPKSDRPDPKPSAPKTDRPDRPNPKPDPRTDPRPDPKTPRPDPKPDRPDPKPPAPKTDRPDPKPPTPKADRPDPKPPTPKADRPDPKPPAPKADRPDPKPAPRPDRPDPKPPTPKADRPDPKPPTPKADRPDPKPPAPKADRPDPKPPTPKGNRPDPKPPAPKPNPKPPDPPDPKDPPA